MVSIKACNGSFERYCARTTQTLCDETTPARRGASQRDSVESTAAFTTSGTHGLDQRQRHVGRDVYPRA